MINIFRNIDGTEKVACRVADDNASIRTAIMGVDEVVIDVTVDSVLDIAIGDYIRIDDIVYELNRDPEFNQKSEIEHQYSFTFEHPLYRLLDKLYIYKVTKKASFALTGRLSDFVELLVWNVNKTNDNLNGVDTGWTVGDIVVTDYKTLTFGNTLCRDVLTKLANDFNLEFFLNNKEINFVGHIENETELEFSQGRGKGLYTVSQKNVDTDNAVTRVYPIGGTQNIPAKHADIDGHLILPEVYIENFSEYGKIVERGVEFSDIVPSFVGAVTSASGENNSVIKCSDIDFNIDEVAVGDEARINFLTGDLMGKSFSFQWDKEKKEIILIEQEDEVALPDDSGKKPVIPNALKKAKILDEFNFTGMNLPDAYITNAIAKLRKAATDWLEFYSHKRIKFELSIDHRYLRGKRSVLPGDLVTIKVPKHNIDKIIRVISVEKKLRTGELTCVVSNYLDEKWEKKIEGQISSIQQNSASGVGGAIIDILEKYDGRVPSDRNVFSSIRTLKEIIDRSISKNRPDRTNHLLELFGGISFQHNYGIDSIGKAKLNSLEADYLKIQELIFNRVSAQEGDTSFSESGVIESVELLPDGTYNLILRKRHETDFTAFGLHDIAYGSVNDLLSGGGNYYSSWFRILNVDLTLNSINVILYPDNEVPGGKNSAPEPLMVITRRGNVVNPKRQSYFFLSSSEGRLVRLNGVTKPILEDYNYASSLGSTPDLAIFDNLPINKNQDYLYARGAIIQDLIRVDIEGKPVYEEIARGIWSLQVAVSEEPYYFEGYNQTKQRNETSTVYNRGSKWQCLRTGTQLEPAYGSPDWAFLEGNGEFTIGFDSSRGFSFFYGRVDTVLEARFYRGYTDVTDTVMSTAGTVIKWSRHSGLDSEDKSWTPTFAGLKNQVRLTDKDMPSNWLQTRVAVFKIEIEVPQGRGNYQNATKEIGIKI